MALATRARVAAAVLVLGACGRHDAAPAGAASASAARPAAPCVGHAACADAFTIDAVFPADCAAGAVCSVGWRVGATGVFHINDEYPYRFKATESPDLRYAGTDPAGTNVFSKTAGDWQKTEAKTGVMTVRFTSPAKGERTVKGTLKLSVCSAANCLLDQREVSATVAVR